MEEQKLIESTVTSFKNLNEEELRKTIKDWFEQTRTDGLKLGAQFISAAVYGVIEKNLKKKAKSSLRDYQRCVDGILKIISVQLTQQNDSEVEEINE